MCEFVDNNTKCCKKINMGNIVGNTVKIIY